MSRRPSSTQASATVLSLPFWMPPTQGSRVEVKEKVEEEVVEVEEEEVEEKEEEEEVEVEEVEEEVNDEVD